ncbi:ABC transporter ATP-binding protein [Staphylococcus caeli]|uniref:Multidrug ABC transporter n=1 Tax=Staphylococcus caeli TaxID=2201815 RepID=A0A1D4NQP0_9STAP|nr:ATP-binding cassette domain-containing protein [Staphylococcus caeli]AWM30241.1 multidrug ABC transporter [Staphylococcus caeli]SCT09948.1 multidrug ABC transporter ATPase [Staphylococcus caeli]SCT13062.1 multidrug ABC transporter ATPase [Staphylococcus caeli]
MLKVNNLSVKYGKSYILNNVSFELKTNEIVGLVGNNGSGKTTLMKAILGFLNYEGEIAFNGNNKFQHDRCQMQKIAMLLQENMYQNNSALFNLSLFEKLNINPSLKEDLKNRLSMYNLPGDKKVKGFSFGMKQRLRLALITREGYDLYILDEPFVGLDPIGIIELKKYLNELKNAGKTILISSHQLTELEHLSDRYLFLNNNRISEKNEIFEKRIIISFESLDIDKVYEEISEVSIKINDNEIILPYDLNKLHKLLCLLSEREKNSLKIQIEQSLRMNSGVSD